jgi:hypothetical protein
MKALAWIVAVVGLIVCAVSFKYGLPEVVSFAAIGLGLLIVAKMIQDESRK